ncbi:transglycosylase domain-containing protein [Alicyclobacillus acidoterrestris]|uniref:Transglycosylase domain-containing protein n=1 Tax=Alicyclobacillus acidoterrestris (strain ATCC 49025 / DSM 3922 / CIP 106132 / NCIMB 13137 / GD3B) TaxID=1356854 RepID=A0A9E6ZEL3_ALIAG|nr:transglycosylase domain-containing protein [Alicyclobacillus acidoterrestris]UNO48090.1 transglycosylase domain-containing protein [Alicyclobacillus acidoterrestris]
MKRSKTHSQPTSKRTSKKSTSRKLASEKYSSGKKRGSRRRGIRAFVYTIGGLFLTGAVLAVVGYFVLLRMTPISIAKLTATPQPTVIYDASGKVYEKIGTPQTTLSYGDIPKNLQNAIVATEDHNFWTGSSVDLKSILRSVVVDITTNSTSQGASTIEDQLAKIVFLNDNKTLSYKLKEIAMGVHIDQDFTKQEILTMYLNKVFLGENTVGVGQAAMRYFGIDLAHDSNQLTLAQAALLAGLPQAPSAYDPLKHPAAARERRNQVLENMVKYGYITEQQAEAAEAQPLGASYHSLPDSTWDTHPLFTNVLFDYASKNGISAQQLLQGGLKVYTTIQPNVQQAVEDVFWSGQYDSDFPGPVDGAAVFVDPATGGIMGAAGSRKQDYTPLGMDRIYSNSSPGSSIKPIMEYAPAIESGQWGPDSILDNAPQDFGGGYVPQNWEGVDGPAKVTLQYALQESQNVASVWLLQQIGLQTGTSFAMKDGIKLTEQDRQHLGVAIGGMQYGVNPVEMAQAYEPFDNNGVQMKVHLINQIVNQVGQTIYQFQPQSKTIMSPQTAATMTSLMEDVVNAGTGTSAQVPGWGVAGKTGTVQYDTGLNGDHPNWIRDAWFDGYTPNMVGSIHIGYDVSSPEHHMTMSPLDPSANAAKIFSDIVRLAEAGETPEQFNLTSASSTPSTSGQIANTTAPGNNTTNATANATANATSNATDNSSSTSIGNTTDNDTTAPSTGDDGSGDASNGTGTTPGNTTTPPPTGGSTGGGTTPPTTGSGSTGGSSGAGGSGTTGGSGGSTSGGGSSGTGGGAPTTGSTSSGTGTGTSAGSGESSGSDSTSE